MGLFCIGVILFCYEKRFGLHSLGNGTSYGHDAEVYISFKLIFKTTVKVWSSFVPGFALSPCAPVQSGVTWAKH